MKNLTNRNLVLRRLKGILAILFGLFALIFPRLSITSLTMVFGFFALTYGILTITGSIWLMKDRLRGWSLWFVEGLFDLLIGIVAILYPAETLSILVVFIGLWTIITGMITLISFHKMRSILPLRSNLRFLSVLSILIGLIILLNPFQSAVVMVVLIGVFAITFGIFSIFNSLKPYQTE